MNWLAVLVPIITDEKKRQALIIAIIITIVIVLLTILLPFYLLITPLESLFLSDTEKKQIQSIKDQYLSKIELQKGHLIFNGRFPMPLEGNCIITSLYGIRIHPVSGVISKHTGIDLVSTHHANILSIADGKVIWTGVQGAFGNCIEIEHNIDAEKFYSFYAHLSKILVISGQNILQGDIIGHEGGSSKDPNPGTSTGHHLHFEIRIQSGYGNDIDPTKYLFQE